jgi:hypothetical protein
MVIRQTHLIHDCRAWRTPPQQLCLTAKTASRRMFAIGWLIAILRDLLTEPGKLRLVLVKASSGHL